MYLYVTNCFGICIFKDNLSEECAVCSPSNKIAPMSHGTIANVIGFFGRMRSRN